jgi:hypothetical protein
MRGKCISLFIAALLSVVLSAGTRSAFAAGGTKYTVTLEPTNLKNSKGTPVTTGSGTAEITLYSARRQICWSIKVQGLRLPAKATYIQTTKRGSVGAIVATLGTPSSSGTTTGCTRGGIRRSLIRDIESNPPLYYVSVRTTQYPAGALRGTL